MSKCQPTIAFVRVKFNKQLSEDIRRCLLTPKRYGPFKKKNNFTKTYYRIPCRYYPSICKMRDDYNKLLLPRGKNLDGVLTESHKMLSSIQDNFENLCQTTIEIGKYVDNFIPKVLLLVLLRGKCIMYLYGIIPIFQKHFSPK